MIPHDTMREMILQEQARESALGTSDANGWFPIETADKSGCDIWLSNGSSMRLGFWRDGDRFENHGSVGGGWRDSASFETSKGCRDLHFLPTHWQPTPRLPIR